MVCDAALPKFFFCWTKVQYSDLEYFVIKNFMQRNPDWRTSGGNKPVFNVHDKNGRGHAKTKPTILTDAENRVLTLVISAKTNKEIAQCLGISPATVKRHIENLLRKLKLRNRVEAAVYGATGKRSRTEDPGGWNF